MRTVFLAVFVLIAFTAVQANRISQPVHVTDALKDRRSKVTLQVKNVPKLAAVRQAMDSGKFAVRVTFAACIDVTTLTLDSFSYDPDFNTKDLKLTEIVKGIQYEISGSATPRPDVTVPKDGLLYYLTLSEGTVRFPTVQTGKGVMNAEDTAILTYYPDDSDFSTNIVPHSGNSPLTPHQGFVITFDSYCAPAAVTRADRKKFVHLFAKYITVSSTSGTAYLESVMTTGSAASFQCQTKGCGTESNGEVAFEVFVATTAADDSVSIKVKKGMCIGLVGGVSLMEKSVSQNVALYSETCGPWSAYGACPAGCFTSNAEFAITGQGQQCRTRQSINGGTCAKTQDCRPCQNKPCDKTGSRPFSGETRNECFGCPNPGYKEWTSASGCKCGMDCEKTGDCCQSWYHLGCSKTGNTAKYQAKDENNNLWTPVTCTTSRCSSAEPYLDDLFPSYYCYCDNTCGIGRDVCCDGKANRDAICKAAPPAGAPGFR